MIAAFLQAESQVNRVLPTLPAGTTFEVRRMDPTVFPVIAYSLTSDSRPLSEVRDIANLELRPILSTITGVAKIGVDGGAVEEYQIVLDPAKLRSHNLAIADVSAALAATNVLTAAGQVEDHSKLYLVVTDTRFKTPEQIGDTILRSGPGGVVPLGAVATIEQTTAPQFTRATANGRDAVLVNVYQQPGGNTVQIAKGIRDALAIEQKRLPADIHISSWYDQSDLITASARSVLDAVLIGVGLAALVLLLFLRNIRITLVAAITVPTVLAVTALLLYLLDQSFNIMTLGGMAAAVGLIIDDAIVMSEHIVRRTHSSFSPRAHAEERRLETAAKPGESSSAVLDATDEFTKPLAGSSLSTIIIHIPPAFLIGVTGAFFAALSLAMAASLIVSFLVAWLVIPVLAARVLRSSHLPAHGEDRRRGIHALYAATMRPVLRFPWMIALLILPLLGLGYLAFNRLPSGFMPSVDEGGFVLDYVGLPGASLTESDRMLRQIEQILKDTPEVQTYSRRTGFSLGGDIQETNMGDFFVRLKPLPRRPIEAVMDDVRKQIEHTLPGMDVELAQLMEDLIGDLTGRPEPIVVNIFTDDEKELTELPPKIADAIGKVPNVVEVQNGIVPAGDALDVQVDPVKASLEGVDADFITKSVSDLLSGSVATQIQRGPKLVDVRVWVPKALRANSLDVAELPIRASDGHVFPLKRVATLATITGQPEITRENLKRVVSITGRISGRDLGSTVRDVQQVLDKPGMLPADVRYTLGGLYEQQQMAFKGMLKRDHRRPRRGTLVFLLLAVPLRKFPRHHRDHADHARRHRGGVCRPAAHAHGAQHLVDDGHGDDRRQRDRGRDLLLFRVRRFPSRRLRS